MVRANKKGSPPMARAVLCKKEVSQETLETELKDTPTLATCVYLSPSESPICIYLRLLQDLENMLGELGSPAGNITPKPKPRRASISERVPWLHGLACS